MKIYGTVKSLPRKKILASNAHIRKKEKFKFNNLNLRS